MTSFLKLMKQLTVGDLEALEVNDKIVDSPPLPPELETSIRLDYEALPSESVPVPVAVRRKPRSSSRRSSLEAMIIRTECTVEHEDMKVNCTIKNNSKSTLILDTIRLLNKQKRISRILQPSREESFLVYEGPQPENTNKTRCKLTYKDARGKRYASEHLVIFQQLANNLYKIKDIQYKPPAVKV